MNAKIKKKPPVTAIAASAQPATPKAAAAAPGTVDRGVRAALENKYDAVVDLELALRAKLTGTAEDDSLNTILELLEDEANALNDVLDNGAGPTINALSPADAEALQNAILKAENTIHQSGSVQSLLNAAAVLVGTLQQSKAP
jgi:hypothetical protein